MLRFTGIALLQTLTVGMEAGSEYDPMTRRCSIYLRQLGSMPLDQKCLQISELRLQLRLGKLHVACSASWIKYIIDLLAPGDSLESKKI